MNPMLAIGAAQVGTSLLGGLFGGGGDKPEFPQWLLDMVMSEYKNSNYSGFLPDKSAYDRSLRAEISEIMSKLPVSMDNFNANLASRGAFGAGEAPKYMYSDVVAPITGAATSAAAQSNLAYTQAYQQGSIAGEQMRLSNLDRVVNVGMGQYNADMANYQYDQQGQAGFFGGMGGAFGNIMNALMLKKMFGQSGFGAGGSNVTF